MEEIEQDLITFIPPNNEYSPGAEQALYDNGFKIISAGFWNSKYGFLVSTYDWEKFRLRDSEDVLKECEEDLDKGETCIIMIHPQDYTTNNQLDSKKYQHYINLLEGINELDAATTTFRDLYYEEYSKEVVRL